MPPEDLTEIKRHLVRHLKHEGPYQVQFRARDAQGQLRWFETQGQAVWDEQGRGAYMAGTSFEITERRRAEQALMDSQAELFQLAQRLLHQERDTHRRLAQSLHDRLGQSLASARLHLDLVREGLGDAATTRRTKEECPTRAGKSVTLGLSDSPVACKPAWLLRSCHCEAKLSLLWPAGGQRS